jgi:hypothetical protein
MNPSNPNSQEVQFIEQLFFEQMREQTRRATNPLLAARIASRDTTLARSFDFQFSDRWL